MTRMVQIEAPCKINLHLRVLPPRPDGYHGIQSIFQRISLADTVQIDRCYPEGLCKLDCEAMDLPQDNTITRAVSLFRSVTGVAEGLRITLTKRVPAGAGLGGGSSDAAATLLGLNRLFDERLSLAELERLALAIGSDVPFFLGSPAAIVTGRGECIESMPPRSDMWGVLIWPSCHSSTAQAYRLVDGWKDSRTDWPDVADLPGLYRAPVSRWSSFGNSFTAPLEAAFPVIADARRAIERAGAQYTAMSGSGSTVFGLFDSEAASETAVSRLSENWGYCVKFLLLAS